MNVVTPNRKEYSPFMQMVLLFVYAILGMFVFGALASGIIYLFYGGDIFKSIISNDINDKSIAAFKILQSFSTPIGMMLVPALLLAITEFKPIKVFYPLQKPKLQLIGIAFLIAVFSNPFLEWSSIINQKLVLPEFLKGLENWMKDKEEVAAELTKKFITVKSVWGFLANLIVIALLPAIGEEFMFRGGLQRCFNRLYKNHHVAIWLSAALFSAIHMQFYGFLPRLLLGAGFGYMCYFGGSLWYAIIAHFINNGVIVCYTYYMQLNNIPLNKVDDQIGFPFYMYLISAIFTIALFVLFKKQAHLNGRQLD
jgi:membrane protease YdiL (CAAX protease family)